MSDKKQEKEEEQVAVPETPFELLTKAAEKLEARRGHRNKTWAMMAAELRNMIDRLKMYE